MNKALCVIYSFLFKLAYVQSIKLCLFCVAEQIFGNLPFCEKDSYFFLLCKTNKTERIESKIKKGFVSGRPETVSLSFFTVK